MAAALRNVVTGTTRRRAGWSVACAFALLPTAVGVVGGSRVAGAAGAADGAAVAYASPHGAVGSSGLTPAARRYPTPFRRSTRVVMLGDSLAQESSPFVKFLMSPREFVPKFWGGTAPCDWTSVDLEASRRSVVIISFTGNSLTPCMSDGAGGFLQDQALVDRYRSDIGVLIDRARRAGAAVVLVGQPVRAASFHADEEVSGINAMYRDFAAAMANVSFVDAGAYVEGPDGTYTDRLPCTSFDQVCDADGTAVVRGDGVHFCPIVGENPCSIWSSGAFRFSMAMVTAAANPRAYE